MSNQPVVMLELNGVMYFEYQGHTYLYLGKDEEHLFGFVGDQPPASIVALARERSYDKVRQGVLHMELCMCAIDLSSIDITTRGVISAAPSVTHTDCRSPVGITVGLIDGMIAMARVLRSSDLSAPEVQEALKDLTSDEDVKFLMERSVQDWEFGEETRTMVGDNWELGDPLTPEHVVGGPVFRTAKRCLTWPMGWESTPITQDFNSKQELLAWLLEQCAWSMLEDNGVDIEIFSMDGTSAIPMGKVKWESTQFINMPLGWKPTFENTLSLLPWLNQ